MLTQQEHLLDEAASEMVSKFGKEAARLILESKQEVLQGSINFNIYQYLTELERKVIHLLRRKPSEH